MQVVRLWSAISHFMMLHDQDFQSIPPSRGEGANTALRDAELLHHKLVEVATQKVSLLQAKVEYETAMLEYGFEAVTNALKKPFFGFRKSEENR
jgi:2-polyprenyl-6-methoxyphenol hydroxylase-like FAD-dependent oxidoreductase